LDFLVRHGFRAKAIHLSMDCLMKSSQRRAVTARVQAIFSHSRGTNAPALLDGRCGIQGQILAVASCNQLHADRLASLL
jgi:hypothetical protein